MELKQQRGFNETLYSSLLIVPYGIETKMLIR